jgi:predicted Rdx family selenoprotein
MIQTNKDTVYIHVCKHCKWLQRFTMYSKCESCGKQIFSNEEIKEIEKSF